MKRHHLLPGIVLLLIAVPGFAAQKKAPQVPRESQIAPLDTEDFLVMVRKAGVLHLLGGQETIGKSEERWEWPYEGVYRERGKIPLGYRVGGTAICAWSLLEDASYATNDAAQEAVERGLRFVLAALEQKPMQPGFASTYDVRDWGIIYALNFLLRMEAKAAVPEALEVDVSQRIAWLVETLQGNAIPQTGGWNYARRSGAGEPAASSPFMTAPAILALWQAQEQGYAIEDAVVELALKSLLAAKVDAGVYAYTSTGGLSKMPGTIGRSPAVEVVLGLAGLSEEKDLRIAVHNFLKHWEELEKRRAKTGTHKGEYGIAPYYFYYAHYYASLAMEQLPEEERPALRTSYSELLLQSMDAGSWTFNDRVFPRSSHFGTAMSLLSLNQQSMPQPAGPKD